MEGKRFFVWLKWMLKQITGSAMMISQPASQEASQPPTFVKLGCANVDEQMTNAWSLFPTKRPAKGVATTGRRTWTTYTSYTHSLQRFQWVLKTPTGNLCGFRPTNVKTFGGFAALAQNVEPGNVRRSGFCATFFGGTPPAFGVIFVVVRVWEV